MKRWIFCIMLTAFSLAAVAANAVDIQACRKANARFTELLAQNEGQTPRDLRTAEFSSLVAVLSDESRFLPARAKQDDMQMLIEICDMSGQQVVSLLQFGTGAIQQAGLSETERTTRLGAMATQNVLEFQEELRLLQPFSLRCEATNLPLVAAFVREMPPERLTEARRRNIGKMRRGYAKLLGGLVSVVASDRYSAQFRQALVHAIADASPAFAGILKPADRDRLLAGLERTDEKARKKFAADFARIRKAFTSPDCSGLCAFD